MASTLNWATSGLSCSESDLDVPPVVAVSVTDCAVDTAEASAANVALVAVAGIVTEAGTFSFVLLLARATVTPFFGAAPDKMTLHESEMDPARDVLLHDSVLKVGAVVVPAPLRLTASVPALLAIANWPVAEPAVVGLK